jgi:multiple sugar transport system substrate-binding protein
VDGVGPNLSNPDALGIPRTAKHPGAAAKFIKWFTSAKVQATSAGLGGQDKAISGFFLPSSLDAIQQLIAKDALPGGDQLVEMLKNSKSVFPGGAPSWYAQFSNAVYTQLHNAAAGDETVDAAMKSIAATAESLQKG